MLKVSAIVTARNEEKYLPQCLWALRAQTYPLYEISVVDDGSMDRTSMVAKQFTDKVTELPYHSHKLFKEPGGIAKRFNLALKALQPCDYILIVGADDVLAVNYVEVLLKRLEANPRLVMASGQVHGHPSDPLTPRGSGRLVKTWFWKEIGNLQFPVLPGWEEYMVYKAILLGYEAKAFPDVEYRNLREESGRSYVKMYGDGMSMYSLGYYWMYALLRAVSTFLRHPKEAYFLWRGFRTHRGVKRTEFADALGRLQKWQIIHGRHVFLWRKFVTRMKK